MIEILKNIFFLAGSVAGLIAFFRPVIESKHQKDMERANSLLEKFNENVVMSLDYCTYASRSISEEVLRPFDEIEYKISKNQQEVRFSGPLRKYLRTELEAMVIAYRHFRKFIQVPEWQPHQIDDSDIYQWIFNRAAFSDYTQDPPDYVNHLEQATKSAEILKKRFQRFQALTELHLYETIVPKWFVNNKYRSINLDDL